MSVDGAIAPGRKRPSLSMQPLSQARQPAWGSIHSARFWNWEMPIWEEDMHVLNVKKIKYNLMGSIVIVSI